MLLNQAASAGAGAGASGPVPMRGAAGADGFHDLLALLTGGGQDAVVPMSVPLPAEPSTGVPGTDQTGEPAAEPRPGHTASRHSVLPVVPPSAPPAPLPSQPVPGPTPVAAPEMVADQPQPPLPVPDGPPAPETPPKVVSGSQPVPAGKPQTGGPRSATPSRDTAEQHHPDPSPPLPVTPVAETAPALPPPPHPAPRHDTDPNPAATAIGAVGARPSDPSASKSPPHDMTPAAPDSTATPVLATAHPAPKDAVFEPARPEPAVPQRMIAEAGATVAARIGRAVQDGTHVLTMELHPAELGRVEVRLSFHDGGIGVQMTLDRPDTFDAFNRNRGGMEQQLADAGINLGSGGLDLRFGQQSGHPAPQPGATTIRMPLPADTTSSNRPPPMPSVRDGLIDILA